MIQNNEEVKNGLLLTTDYTAQETPFQISQSLSVATENVDTSVIATTAISTPILQENMPLNTQTSEYDIKDKVCSKIMDETTLRIYFPIGFPKERPSQEYQNLRSTQDTVTLLKTNEDDINSQG